MTASYNRPGYGGVKFSAAWGGPVLPPETKQIEDRANMILADGGPGQAPVGSLAEAEARGLIALVEEGKAFRDG